mmetsp:Transcript_1258/g.3342  ORF Transcript_1258/g.3342 Transcript_1258/m.3342 type:complete len:205 (+) Transcript_1258:498-1112(+)
MHGASAMDLLVSEGIGAYAIDLRGMGSTRRDPSGWTTPEQSVDDVTDVLNYLKSQNVRRPMLIGWSQGALIAQLIAQFRSEIISSVVLYGSIYNPDTEFEQGNKKGKEAPPVVMNTWEGAMEDWTLPGAIDEEAASAFGATAMRTDARKVSWTGLDFFHKLDPALVRIPALVIYGEVRLPPPAAALKAAAAKAAAASAPLCGVV